MEERIDGKERIILVESIEQFLLTAKSYKIDSGSMSRPVEKVAEIY